MDYTAANDNKVSFREDHYTVDANIIDVEECMDCIRQHRMLPSNYVEKITRT